MEIHVETGMKENKDLGGGEWLVWGQGPDPCFPAPPQERWCPPRARGHVQRDRAADAPGQRHQRLRPAQPVPGAGPPG